VKLNFSPEADRRTLIRRATFDLHGLPPTAEEVAAFEADSDPRAYERLIDRLLASPRYGERWARHWLDVARYADNEGGIFGVNNKYAHAWTYRDYVVRSLNEDKPYNQFVTEQLAADLLPSQPNDNRHWAALGFITVGRRPNGRVDDDVVDDRIDVVSWIRPTTSACGAVRRPTQNCSTPWPHSLWPTAGHSRRCTDG
jgi:hypothetical protein